MPGLVNHRDYYKPFTYPKYFSAMKRQFEMFWLPTIVPLQEDQSDWKYKLTDAERSLLTQLFRFFVQADSGIASGYINNYIPMFKNPEVRGMLSSFASQEFIHIWSYSLLLDTVGMPEVEYKKFTEYEDMAAKHEYITSFKADTQEDVVRSLAVYSAFGEGLQLYSSFAILLNFPRHNKMKGMGQIVTLSSLDEDLHVNSMISLFHDYLDENPKVWKPALKKEITEIAKVMVDLEDKFIDLAFEGGGIEGLTKEEIKTFIRYLADRRLLQLGLKTHFKQKTNPIPWFDEMLNAPEHTHFFENTASSYTQGQLTGNWEDAVYK